MKTRRPPRQPEGPEAPECPLQSVSQRPGPDGKLPTGRLIKGKCSLMLVEFVLLYKAVVVLVHLAQTYFE